MIFSNRRKVRKQKHELFNRVERLQLSGPHIKQNVVLQDLTPIILALMFQNQKYFA